MIKEHLMKALKSAADSYNDGMNANAAVAKAASAEDFNDRQTDRLVEMFNTALALGQEKSASNPTGTCELADKAEVAKILLEGSEIKKTASCAIGDETYSFYGHVPAKTTPRLEAVAAGRKAIVKAAAASDESVPAEMDVSQRSLYKIISGQIETLKAAAAAADEVIGGLGMEVDDNSKRIAMAVEALDAFPGMADMFKAACSSTKALERIAEYSTKIAESDGGAYAKMAVFDSSPVDDLVKLAEKVELGMSQIDEYKHKRDFYMRKAAEAHDEMLSAVGLGTPAGEGKVMTLADMFIGSVKAAREKSDVEDDGAGLSRCIKMAYAMASSGEGIEDMDDPGEQEKQAAASEFGLDVPSVSDIHGAVSGIGGIDSEKKRMLNARRAVLLSDLLSNDPIIRDADPNVVAEAYKTMVMASPRVSLDKAQVRAFLRSAVNSVAISPADAKTLVDVDKGVSLSNIDRLTTLDSSIKDSNY